MEPLNLNGLYVCTIFTNGLYNGLYGDMDVCTIFTNGLYNDTYEGLRAVLASLLSMAIQTVGKNGTDVHIATRPLYRPFVNMVPTYRPLRLLRG